MANTVKNLYNRPSDEVFAEILRRRLGIVLDPGLVTYGLSAGSQGVSITDEPLGNGNGTRTSFTLTKDGLDVQNAAVSGITMTDGSLVWALSPMPHSNSILYSDDLSQSVWGKHVASVTDAGVSYAGYPYWNVTVTNGTQLSANVHQDAVISLGSDEHVTLTVALRGTVANNIPASLMAYGLGNATLVTTAPPKVLSGPGSVTSSGFQGFFNGTTINGVVAAVSGLSTDEDTLLQLSVRNFAANPLDLYVALIAGDTRDFYSGSFLATRVQLDLGDAARPYVSSGAVAASTADFSVSGDQAILNAPPTDGSSLTWSGTGDLPPMMTISANPNAPDGARSPFIGSITYPLSKVSISTQLPDPVVWSGTFPMSVDDLAAYLLDTYDYYLEDGEFYAVGDVNETPMVRGDMVQGTLNQQDLTFQLEATNQARRWTPGSRINFQQASANSIVGLDGMALEGSPPEGTLGLAYDYTYTVVNGTPPYTFTVVQGTAPAPLDPVTGNLHADTLSVVGDFNWIVEVVDAEGRRLTQIDTVTVSQPSLTFSPPTQAPQVTTGVATSIDLGISGGVAPLSVSVYSGALPETVKIQNGTIVGAFEGNLNAGQTALSMVVGIQVDDAVGASIQRLFTITITDRTEAQLTSSLSAKLLNWYETPPYALNDGDVWYDATGRMDLQASGNLSLTTGPGSAQAVVFAGATAHANTVAFNFNSDFALVGWIKNTAGIAVDQSIISRGANADGGWALKSNATGGLKLGVTLDGTPQEVDFQNSYAQDDWEFITAQFYNNVPELETNAGSIFYEDAILGGLTANTSDFLTLGSDPSRSAGSFYQGASSLLATFTTKLWSDERKWLYNAGSVRSFAELGYYSETLQATSVDPVTQDQDVAYSVDVTLSGGSGVYPWAPVVVSGSLPDGFEISIPVSDVFTISGTPSVPGTYDATVQARSTDGQTVDVDVSIQVNEVVVQTQWSGTQLTSNMAITSDSLTAYGTVTGPSGNYGQGTSGVVCSTTARRSGKYYVEWHNTGNNPNWQFTEAGLYGEDSVDTAYGPGNGMGVGQYGWAEDILGNSSTQRASRHAGVVNNSINVSGYILNSLFKMAVDFDAGKIWMSYPGQNGWIGGGDPATGASPTYTFTPGERPYYLAANPSAGYPNNPTGSCAVTFVDPADWTAEAPAGFRIWSTHEMLDLSGSVSSLTVGNGVDASLVLVGGGLDDPNVTLGASLLPPGVTATVTGRTIAIQGTPTDAGSYSLTVNATSSDGQSLTLIVPLPVSA